MSDRDEMGSDLRRRTAIERGYTNFVGFDSHGYVSNTSAPNIHYCPTCPHNKMLSKYADTDDKLWCARTEASGGWDALGCGKIFLIEDLEAEEEEPIEQQYGSSSGGKRKPIIASQKPKQKPAIPSDVPAGATYYHEEDYNP